MSDEAAFLRAIQASPTDATAKLVYADWLDEHGEDGKAEYMRLEAKRLSEKKLSDTDHSMLRALAVGHRVWVELVRYTPVWDEVTMYALGRLRGLLGTYAAVNGHDSDISYYFDVSLLPLTGALAEAVNQGSHNGSIRYELEQLADWESCFRDTLREWLFRELRSLPTAAHTRLAVQTERGREWCIQDALDHVRAVIRPTAGWRLLLTGGQRGGIDWADLALESPDRVLLLHFSFDD